jgi:hydrogenase nickel incorporation protein HypA/HybF
MHEMSIVSGILDIAENEARSAGARVINSVEIEVGHLAGVEIPSLEFCFEVARRGTLAEQADLVIHEIPGLGHCPDCDQDVAVDYFVAVCPACGLGLVEILQGKELRVRSINVD